MEKVNVSGVFSNDTAAQAAVDKTETTLLNMDNAFLMIIMGLSLAVLISAYFAMNHPAFFFFVVILLLIAVFVATIMCNSYETFTGIQDINSTAAHNFTKIQFVVDKLPFYIAIMGFTTAIVMYIGYQRGGGN